MIYGKSADAFKPFEEISLADPRQQSHCCIEETGPIRPVGIEDYHADLTHLELNESVPQDIRVGFDTARNLYLYSWYVYRFRTTAELQAYAALEFAIKQRVGYPEADKLRGLTRCLEIALKEKWFKDAKMRIYRKKFAIWQETRERIGEEAVPLDLEADAWVGKLKDSFGVLRNPIAHGEPILLGSTLQILAICCDLINQLFPAK